MHSFTFVFDSNRLTHTTLSPILSFTHSVIVIHFIHSFIYTHTSFDSGFKSPEVDIFVRASSLQNAVLSKSDVPPDCGQVNTRFPPSRLKCLHVLIMSGITFCIILCLSIKLSAGSSTPTTWMDQSLLKSGISLSWIGCTCFFSPECSAFQFLMFHLIVDKWILVFHPLVWSVCMCWSCLE